MEAAAKFDYRPSFYARSLRKRQTFSIGVLIPDLNDNYAAQVLTGMEELLIEEGYFYLTASHRRKPDLIEEYPRLLMDRSVEGFIMIDTLLEHGLKLPVVAVAGHRKIEGVTNVVLDQRRAAELALRHLYQLGHRKIAFMRGGSHSSDADERWECQMAVARDLKLDVPPELTAQIQLRVSTPEMGFGPANELFNRGDRLYRHGLLQRCVRNWGDPCADGPRFACAGRRIRGRIRRYSGRGLPQPQPHYHSPAPAANGHGGGAHSAATDTRPGHIPGCGADLAGTGDSRIDLSA